MARTLKAQVEAQPYTIGDWAEFAPLSVTDLGVLVLGNAQEADPWEFESWHPLLSMAVSASPSPLRSRRATVALRALEFTALVADIEAEESCTICLDGAEWHELTGRGRSLFDEGIVQEVVLFQSIGFGVPGQPFLRVVGVAPAELRTTLLPRFHRLARSISPKAGRTEWQPDGTRNDG